MVSSSFLFRLISLVETEVLEKEAAAEAGDTEKGSERTGRSCRLARS